MRKKNTVTDSSYKLVLEACKKVAQWEHTLALLQKQQGETKRDMDSYQEAFRACENGVQWRRVLVLLRDMIKDQLDPDNFSYRAAFKICEDGGQWRRALSLLEQMKAAQIELNRLVYIAAIKRASWVRTDAIQLLPSIETRPIGAQTEAKLLRVERERRRAVDRIRMRRNG